MEAVVVVVVCMDGPDRTVLVWSGDGQGSSGCSILLLLFGQCHPLANVPATEHGIWSLTLDQALASMLLNMEEVRCCIQDGPCTTGHLTLQGIEWMVTYVQLEFDMQTAKHFVDEDSTLLNQAADELMWMSTMDFMLELVAATQAAGTVGQIMLQ